GPPLEPGKQDPVGGRLPAQRPPAAHRGPLERQTIGDRAVAVAGQRVARRDLPILRRPPEAGLLGAHAQLERPQRDDRPPGALRAPRTRSGGGEPATRGPPTSRVREPPPVHRRLPVI